MNNGYASEFFKLQRGVRLGCPLSATLFVLCTEILGNAIRQDKTISGIKIFDREFKISQYADDTTVFVSFLIYGWLPRKLTLYSRNTILKMRAFSKLIYNTSMSSFPSSFVSAVNQAIKSFIWGKQLRLSIQQ